MLDQILTRSNSPQLQVDRQSWTIITKTFINCQIDTQSVHQTKSSTLESRCRGVTEGRKDPRYFRPDQETISAPSSLTVSSSPRGSPGLGFDRGVFGPVSPGPLFVFLFSLCCSNPLQSHLSSQEFGLGSPTGGSCVRKRPKKEECYNAQCVASFITLDPLVCPGGSTLIHITLFGT